MKMETNRICGTIVDIGRLIALVAAGEDMTDIEDEFIETECMRIEAKYKVEIL